MAAGTELLKHCKYIFIGSRYGLSEGMLAEIQIAFEEGITELAQEKGGLVEVYGGQQAWRINFFIFCFYPYRMLIYHASFSLLSFLCLDSRGHTLSGGNGGNNAESRAGRVRRLPRSLRAGRVRKLRNI